MVRMDKRIIEQGEEGEKKKELKEETMNEGVNK